MNAAAAILGGLKDQASRLRRVFAGQPAPTPTPLGRVAGVASGKGGVGKTSIAVNLSIALRGLGRRVVLADADAGTGNADVLCGVTVGRRMDACVRADGTVDPGSLAIAGPGGITLYAGATSPAMFERESGAEAFRSLIAQVSREHDHTLIDAGAGIGEGVVRPLLNCALVLVVLTPEPTSITDGYALCKRLWSRPDAPALGLVVNQARDEGEATRVRDRVAGVCSKFLGKSPAWLGWIPMDPVVRHAVMARRPMLEIAPDADASRAIRAMARVLDERWPALASRG